MTPSIQTAPNSPDEITTLKFIAEKSEVSKTILVPLTLAEYKIQGEPFKT